MHKWLEVAVTQIIDVQHLQAGYKQQMYSMMIYACHDPLFIHKYYYLLILYLSLNCKNPWT